MGEVWENKFKTDFDNNEGNGEANIGADVDLPD